MHSLCTNARTECSFLLIFMEKPSFFLDENISKRLYNRLKDEGYLVKSIHTENLCGLKNGKVIAESAFREMVLLTSDQDFLKPPKMNHAGILVLKIHPRRDKVVIPMLISFLGLSEIKSFDWDNKIVLLTERGYELIF